MKTSVTKPGALSHTLLRLGLALASAFTTLSQFPIHQFPPEIFPGLLASLCSSTQPYLMNFSMTSSTHICSLRKLMP